MREISELRIREFGREAPRSSPSDDQIKMFESLIGHRLPGDYIRLIKHSNGGFPEVDTYHWQGRAIIINNFFHFSQDSDPSDEIESIQWAYRLWKNQGPEYFVPIARDILGNQIGLDFSKDEPIPVAFWQHDPAAHKIQHISPSFGEFIDSLEQRPPE